MQLLEINTMCLYTMLRESLIHWKQCKILQVWYRINDMKGEQSWRNITWLQDLVWSYSHQHSVVWWKNKQINQWNKIDNWKCLYVIKEIK